jgi:hypothetical protein
MRCPKCNKLMSEGYSDILNYGLNKPVWSCSDYRKCKYEIPRDKPKPESKNIE